MNEQAIENAIVEDETGIANGIHAEQAIADEIVVGDVADIDAELSQLLEAVADEDQGVKATVMPPTGDSAIDLEEIEHTLIVADAKAATYAEAEGDADVPAGATPVLGDPSDVVNTSTVTPIGKGKKARSTTPRVSTAGLSPSQIMNKWPAEELAKAAMSVTGSDAEDEIKSFLGTVDKLAKKVGEKAINLLKHRAKPASVQVYTRLGLEQLVKDGEVTSKGLVTLLSTKYKPGTARSQANQLMQLFPALGIADRVGKGHLKLKAGSNIVASFTGATA